MNSELVGLPRRLWMVLKVGDKVVTCMILKTEIPLDQKETGGSLHDKLAEAGAKLCVETLKCLEDKTATWASVPVTFSVPRTMTPSVSR